MKARSLTILLLSLLVLLNALCAFSVPYREEEGEEGREWRRGERGGRAPVPYHEEEEEEGREWRRGERGGRAPVPYREEEGEEEREWRRGERGGGAGRGEEEREWRRRERGGGEEEDFFLLHDSKRLFRTEAGEMKVVRSFGGRIVERPMHIGFITMDPQTLFVPQYLDSNLVLFVRRGEAKIGAIYEDELVERRLKIGDIYRVPAGSAFYLVNIGEGQRLHLIASIDTSASLGLSTFQSFFIGGGSYPASVLTGFEPETLATAFNVSVDEVTDLLTGQQEGPIMYINDDTRQRPSLWSNFLQLKEQDRLQHLKRMLEFHGESKDEENDEEEEEEEEAWSWRKFLSSIFPRDDRRRDERRREGRRDDRRWRTGKGPDSYNLYERRPDFRNDYGSSVALDESDYEPLRHSGIGVYLVNLTAGSMMAPHVNPRATEYGIVIRGSGTIQIGYPNGSSAVNAKVQEGDVFMVPRYFPFCQISSRSGPLEFFGFTTSARRNRPQFLVGRNSVLQKLLGPELAAAFGVSNETTVRGLVDAQREAVILPSASAAPPYVTAKRSWVSTRHRGVDGDTGAFFRSFRVGFSFLLLSVCLFSFFFWVHFGHYFRGLVEIKSPSVSFPLILIKNCLCRINLASAALESSAMRRNQSSVLVVTWLLLFGIVSRTAKAEVITLTADTFSDKIKEKDTAWFVKFCVPWCKHCKNLGSLWEDLGKEIEGEDEIEIGEVDCATNKQVCSKVDIHSYPTFKVFYDGEEVAKYQGPRNIESLKTFVLEEAEKAAAKAQLDDEKEL
ncbi:Cupin type-1 domain-containing protein [Psidium guajava]|nr:Cupin type-1 domain-containing protein [Psidium guajava]